MTVFAGIVSRLFAAAVDGSRRETPRGQRGDTGGNGLGRLRVQIFIFYPPDSNSHLMSCFVLKYINLFNDTNENVN